MKLLKKLLYRLSIRNDNRRWADGYSFAAVRLVQSGGRKFSELVDKSNGEFDNHPFDSGIRSALLDWRLSVASIGKFTEAQLKQAVAAEREACAKICDEQHDRARSTSAAARADACARAIRRRKD